jgi:predicted TIM-barrel fold metal-dependent hydrolase
MGIIDTHVHLYPPEANAAPAGWAEAHGESLWAVLCLRRRKDGRAVQGFPSTAELLRAMDRAEVEQAVLQGWYWENHDTGRKQNRFYERCLREHPDRLQAFATVNPRAGRAAVAEELRWAAEAGFRGLGELSPHSQGILPDDPVLSDVFSLAAELRLPVNLHVTEPAGKAYPGRVATPLDDFVRWARGHPATTFILAHWGARLPLDPALGADARALPNILFDSAASPLLYPAAVWRDMVGAIGADRILFGTDFPLVLYPGREAEPSMASLADEARSSGLDATAWSAISEGNARRLLGIKTG